MDNETIRRVLHLSDSEYKSMVEFQKRVEPATLCYCTDHDIEWFDFENGCYACIEERQEFEDEMQERLLLKK